MEHFGLLSFLRPPKTWGAADGRDPAPVKVGMVYPHYLYWVSYLLSVISRLLTHQHQQYHQARCHVHDICPWVKAPTSWASHQGSNQGWRFRRWFSVRWWLSHPEKYELNRKSYPHRFQGFRLEKCLKPPSLHSISRQPLCLRTLRLPQHLRKLNASRIAEASTRLHSCEETKSLNKPPHMRSNGENSKNASHGQT